MSTLYPTQSISVTSSVPIKQSISSTATISVSPTITTSSVQIIAANPSRIGLLLYNNSANSRYIAYAPTANSSTNMTVIIPTFATWVMPYPIYTGALSAIGNAGTGNILVTELT